MAPKMFEVSFKENYAILSMKCGENRLNPKFLEDFNCALDKIERYLILFSWSGGGCGVWSVICEKLKICGSLSIMKGTLPG